MDGKDANGFEAKRLGSIDSPKVEITVNRDDENDSKSLLQPRRDGISRKLNKTPRNVQWNDRKGNKLAEVLEYEPSDASDSDDDNSNSCICTIM